jgi:HSP20 family protein
MSPNRQMLPRPLSRSPPTDLPRATRGTILDMPCDPLGDLRAWQERLERLSLHHSDSWAPPIDVYETDRTYVIAVEVPGLVRDQIELSVEKSRITIHGRRDARPDAGAVHFHQIERGHGTFRRSFEFAASIDAEHISADLASGVLTVTVPKVPPPPARKIEVR